MSMAGNPSRLTSVHPVRLRAKSMHVIKNPSLFLTPLFPFLQKSWE